MKRFLVFLCTILLVFGVVGSSAAFYMDFEEGLGNNGGLITGIPGVTFTNSAGLDWVYADCSTGGYNAYSVDTGNEWGTGEWNMYGFVSSWLGVTGNWGRIDFADQDGTWFQTGVSTATDFWLEAYDSDNNLIDTDMTGPNLRYINGSLDMAWLRVDAPVNTTIAYVILRDSGNQWTVDNMVKRKRRKEKVRGGILSSHTFLLLMNPWENVA